MVALFGGPGAPGRHCGREPAGHPGRLATRGLVDLDLTGAAVAVHVRALQPAWNILDVAEARPSTPEAWDQGSRRPAADGRSSHGARALCGLGRPRERSKLSATFVEQLIAHLAERFDHVLLDLGDEPLSDASTEALVGAAALAADHVLLVAAPDPLSVHHAQIARDEASAVLDLERASLVLNRCDRGQDATSCAAALQIPLVARIPFDARVQGALADSRRSASRARGCASRSPS